MKLLQNINTPADLKELNKSQLPALCKEIQEFIIESVSETGGHLGSSLGTVEICVALHYVFSCPEDTIAFDVGHQSYAHKILTERKDKFNTLRKKDGISGFSNPLESKYDAFIGGHSSTSISSAFGVAQANRMNNSKAFSIAVIGDAAIASGIAFEALNHGCHLKLPCIIILNDNNMSISKTEGSLTSQFAKMKSSYIGGKVKDIKELIIENTPGKLKDIASSISSVTHLGSSSNIFENMGCDYMGPLDGHNVIDLVEIFTNIKKNEITQPILIHACTNKGNGHKDASSHSERLHGFPAKSTSSSKANGSEFVNTLSSLAKEDEKIVAVSAAMLSGTKLSDFQKEFPDRTFDIGIAEQHAVTFAAALAKKGLKPYVGIYSTFMQRAYDQVIHDITIESLPVRIVMDRASFVGDDGFTHHGLYDYNMFVPIPNIVFMAPSNTSDIGKMITLMNDINDKPSFIRYYKSSNGLNIETEDVKLGKGTIIEKGENVAIISIGEILSEVIKASDKLKKNDINPTVVDARFLKPIDSKLIEAIAQNHKHIVVVEEGYHSIFFASVYNVLEKAGLANKCSLKSICVKDDLISHMPVSNQQKQGKVSSDSIFNTVLNLIN